MADTSTVARPYAKAIFELAGDKNALAEWDTLLKLLVILSTDASVLDFVHNPASTVVQQVELLMSVIEDLNLDFDKVLTNNFLSVLAENHRLPVLVDIQSQFVAMRDDYEKTIEVIVVSYAPLTKVQEERLVERLATKLQRKVKLNISINESLQGGAIICAGHLVYDASVSTQIKKLSSFLAA